EQERRIQVEVRKSAETVGNVVEIEIGRCRACRCIHQTEAIGAIIGVGGGAGDGAEKLPDVIRKGGVLARMADQGDPRHAGVDGGRIGSFEAAGSLSVKLEASSIEHDLVCRLLLEKKKKHEREIEARAEVVVEVDRE